MTRRDSIGAAFLAIRAKTPIAPESRPWTPARAFPTRIVAARPVITPSCVRRERAATIDPLVPWQGDGPRGTRVEGLHANRLLPPTVLVRVGPWAATAALTADLGRTAAPLNDDRLGRAWEPRHEHAGDI